MATNNAINCKTAGIVTYDGSGTFSADTTTNHNVLVGAASNGITNVAPSATSGVPIISQGASSDPTFGTAVVAGGGTGVNSFTAYSVIAGGTTSTAALQNVSGLGSSGQILTSNGSSALPTWQTAPSPGTFSPNSVVNFVDDYIEGVALSTIIKGGSNSFVISGTTDNGHPGTLSTNSNVQSFVAAIVYGATNGIILGGGAVTINWVFKISTLSSVTNRYTLRIGLGDTTSTSDQSNGTYVEYSDNINSGNWVFKTANGGSRTTSNSSTAVTAAWHNAQITINAGATSVAFSVDGVSLGTAIITNIPTLGVTPLFWSLGSAGNGIGTTNIYVDLVYMIQTLTSAR